MSGEHLPRVPHGQGPPAARARGSAHEPRPERARFLRRDNRFVAHVERADGDRVRAYVPNTGRLDDLLLEDAEVMVEPARDPRRRTRWTLTRVWDGTWVALDALAPGRLVAEALRTGTPLPGWPRPLDVRPEVTLGHHRFDLAVDLADGRTGIVEVKSLTSARDGTAPLSSTPSARGVAHLEELAALARRGDPAAAVFVVQRGDVEVLDLTAPAAATWTDAVRRARRDGVLVAAYACEVDEARLRLGRALVVRDQRHGPGQTRSVPERDQATSATTSPT